MPRQPSDLDLTPPSDTDRAVLGMVTSEEIHAFVDGYLLQQPGSGTARLRFRAGRIDTVRGVDLDDGRALVISTADVRPARRPLQPGAGGGLHA